MDLQPPGTADIGSDQSKLLTVTEAAARSGLSPHTILGGAALAPGPTPGRKPAAGPAGGEGLTQIELGARSGLTHEAISRLETGRYGIYAETVRVLAQALRVAPEHFISQELLGVATLTVAEAASLLDVPAGRMQVWVKDGLLPGTKVSGQWRVPTMAVAELDRSGRLRGRSRRLAPRYRG